MENSALVYYILTFIPKGQVSTYQKIARISGLNNPRVVGNILHKNPDPGQYPCHRVVNAQGQLAANFAFGGASGQRQKLLAEEITFKDNFVDLENHLWEPDLLLVLYFKLLALYGAPGPWPWFNQGAPHDHDEIVIGAILTQNTNWRNVQKSLDNLHGKNCCTLEAIHKTDLDKLKILINPSGFYNQKAVYLKEFARYMIENYQNLTGFLRQPLEQARQQQLSLKGIGPETADTILLYVGDKPIFVIDAYTKRFIKTHQINVGLKYDQLQSFFMAALPCDVKLYQDYHALIVNWAKYSGSPLSDPPVGQEYNK